MLRMTSRELYKEINPAFIASWKKSSGNDIEVKHAHGGSTKQAQAVAEGLEVYRHTQSADGPRFPREQRCRRERLADEISQRRRALYDGHGLSRPQRKSKGHHRLG